MKSVADRIGGPYIQWNLEQNLQRASTGFLCEMSVDRMSLDIIYKENHVSFNYLLHFLPFI